MAYPKYKTIKKKFLWWNYESEQEDGWECRGRTGADKGDEDTCHWVAFPCKICGADLYVGREKSKSFIYCPRCLNRKFIR